jgi:hypothetical protein
VQSYRGLVERMFARLKKWDVLSGGLVDSIDTKEMELDCAMALQNLVELFKLGLGDDIPDRAPFSANAHIITADLEPSMKIPAALALDSVKIPDHVRRFHAALSTIVPRLNKVLLAENGERIFTPRLEQRGINLFLGGNVLQYMLDEEDLDVWRVRVSVGASMKPPTYKCYTRLNANQGVIQQICECKNG